MTAAELIAYLDGYRSVDGIVPENVIDDINAVTDSLWTVMVQHDAASHREYVAIDDAVRRLNLRAFHESVKAEIGRRVVDCAAVAAAATQVTTS